MPERVEATSDRSAAAAVALAYQRERGALLAYLFRLVEQRETAEDLCQETFLRALCCWEQRDPTKQVRPWLYRIATNLAYDYLRRYQRVHSTSLHRLPDLLDDRQDLETRMGEQLAIQGALACLTPRDAALLLRAHGAAENQQRIAADTGYRYHTLRVRLHRARLRFQRISTTYQ